MWQEGKRVFGNRRFLLLTLIVVILNLFFYLDDQRKEYAGVLAEGESLSLMSEELEEMIAEYGEDISDEKLEKEVMEYSGENQGTYANLYELWQQAKYFRSYSEEKELRRQNMENYQSISVFQKEDSVVMESAKKTLGDYERVQEVEPEYGNYRMVESILNAKMTKYLYLILLICVCMSFLQERKLGFLGIVHLSSGGREKLEAKRIGLLFLSTVILTILLYGSIFCAGVVCYGGVSDLGNPAQSVAAFSAVTLPFSVGALLARILAGQILGGFILALLIHAVLLGSVNQVAALGGMGLFGVLEAVLWEKIAPQSRYVVFKYCNLAGLLEIQELSALYLNLNICGKVIGIHILFAVLAVTLGIASAATALILSGKMYPYGRRDVFAGIGEFFQKIWSGIMRRYTYLGFELHKLLVQQKGWLVLLLFAVMVCRGMETRQMVFDSLTEYENYYYAMFAGDVNRYTIKEIREEAALIEAKEQELAEVEKVYQEGELTMAEYQMMVGEGAYLSYKKEALQQIWDDVGSLMNDAKESGMTLSLVNPLGWKQLIGEEGEMESGKIILEELFLIILLFAGIFAYEYQTGAATLLRGCRGGRGRNYAEKFAMAEILMLLMLVVDFFVRYYAVGQQYGLYGLDAAVQSLSWMRRFPLHCSIRMYLILGVLGKWMVFSAVGGVVFFLSVRLKNSLKALAVSLVLLELPGLLGWRGIPPFQKCSILRIADWNMVMTQNVSCGLLLILLLILAIGIAAAFHLTAEEYWENGL